MAATKSVVSLVFFFNEPWPSSGFIRVLENPVKYVGLSLETLEILVAWFDGAGAVWETSVLSLNFLSMTAPPFGRKRILEMSASDGDLSFEFLDALFPRFTGAFVGVALLDVSTGVLAVSCTVILGSAILRAGG